MPIRSILLISLCMFVLAPKSAAQEAQAPRTSAADASPSSDPLAPFVDRHRVIFILAGADDQVRDALVRTAVANAPSIAGASFVFAFPGSPTDVEGWWQTVGADAPIGVSAFADESGTVATRLLGEATTQPVAVILSKDGSELFRMLGDALSRPDAFTIITNRLDAETGKTARAQYNLSGDNTPGVEGFDIVEYFLSNRAVRGDARIAARYQGVTYRFASAANRARFVQDPHAYLPAYGGWCASAMGAKGTKVEIDPTSFKVKDGRLFLFYKGFFADALKDWNEHESEWEPAADANWRKITGEAPRTALPGAAR